MKRFSLLKRALGAAALLAATPAAMAASLDQNDAFYKFSETVTGWTNGALGVGLATTMLLMGGAIGVARNTPMPALSGIAGAAFLHWGPDIINQLMVGGAVI